MDMYFKSDLSFKLDHKMIIYKSYKILCFKNRNINNFRNPSCKKTYYMSIVRSKLEFESLIWAYSYST